MDNKQPKRKQPSKSIIRQIKRELSYGDNAIYVVDPDTYELYQVKTNKIKKRLF